VALDGLILFVGHGIVDFWRLRLEGESLITLPGDFFGGECHLLFFGGDGNIGDR